MSRQANVCPQFERLSQCAQVQSCITGAAFLGGESGEGFLNVFAAAGPGDLAAGIATDW